MWWWPIMLRAQTNNNRPVIPKRRAYARHTISYNTTPAVAARRGAVRVSGTCGAYAIRILYYLQSWRCGRPGSVVLSCVNDVTGGGHISRIVYNEHGISRSRTTQYSRRKRLRRTADSSVRVAREKRAGSTG